MDVRASRAADHESKAKPSSIEAASEVYQRPFFPTPVGTPGGKPQRLTDCAKKERERPYSHSLVLLVGASQTPFPQKAKKDCSTFAALFVSTLNIRRSSEVYQRPSEGHLDVLSHQRSSEVIRGHQSCGWPAATRAYPVFFPIAPL